MKVNITIDTPNISGLRVLEMDDFMSAPVTASDLESIECVKADGLYFKLPSEHNNNLQELLVDEAIISEFEALGLQRIMDRYVAPYCKISVA